MDCFECFKVYPLAAYIVAYLIAVSAVCVGDLTFITPLITQLYLLTYLLINWSVFQLELFPSPSFRPSFRSYHKYTALAGSVLCAICMFASDLASAVIAIFLAMVIVTYVTWYPNPSISWGVARASWVYRSLINALRGYNQVLLNRNINDYRPHFLAIVHHETDPLIELLETFSHYDSNAIYLEITVTDLR